MTTLRWGAVSITGNFRENNEDRCLTHADGRYFLVADGMGGQAAGEKASELATTLIPQKLEERIDFDSSDSATVTAAIDQAVAYANTEIIRLGRSDPAYHNMGTTINFLIHAAGRLYAGGVGDSRVYRLRGKKFEQLTTDHSLTQALVDAGTISEAEAQTHRYRNVLYRYLGTKEGSAGTNATPLDPQAGDRFLLCSDGVTDGVEDGPLKTLLHSHDDPQSAADAIVQAALDGGSKDNITCVVVFVE
ncbi:MAG: PP2C family protein-serine/threonine phosphatase [Planctomycetaceae bacterium]